MAEQFPYEDIVNMPHHVSKKYPQPTMADRAARFAPFAAITGYEEMVLEEARVTDDRIEMDESSKAALNEKLNMILEFIDEQRRLRSPTSSRTRKKPEVPMVTVTGTVKRIDEYEHLVIMTDGKKINIDDIYNLQSELFYSLGLEE